MTLRLLLILCAISTVPVSSAFADVLEINVPISGVSHSYTPPDPFFGGPGASQDQLNITMPATLPNLRLADFTDISFTLAAPAGQKLVIGNGGTFSMYFGYVGGAGSGSGSPCTMTFSGSGTAPVPTYQLCNVTSSGLAFVISLFANFAPGYELTSINVLIPLAGVTPAAARNFTFTEYASPNFSFYFPAASDPGANVSLRPLATSPSAVPEPSTWALTALAGMAGVAIRSRRSRSYRR